ncbi:MAG: hypothetical protein WA395_09350 [Nitrososphaeraceae archaeon]
MRKKVSEKAEIEPNLTFLNIHQLERQGADIQTKVEKLESISKRSVCARFSLKILSEGIVIW